MDVDPLVFGRATRSLVGVVMNINTVKDLKQYLRTRYAWPGGYNIRLYCSDGEALCHDCARENFRELVQAVWDGDHEHGGWRVAFADVHWEGPSEFCGHCNKELPSEYGDPDAEEEEPAPTCAACQSGPLAELGTLGNRLHLRCQACGIDQSIKLAEKD